MSHYAAFTANGGQDQSFLSLDDLPSSPQQADAQLAPSTSNRLKQNTDSPLPPSGLEEADAARNGYAASKLKHSPRQSSPPRSNRQRILEGIDQYRIPLASSSNYASHSPAESTSPHISPRPPTKGPSSRGSRLGALLGRGKSNNAALSKPGSSVDPPSDASHDSAFFGRRLRSKASSIEPDTSEDTSPQRSSTLRISDKRLEGKSVAEPPGSGRSASAMGMLDIGSVATTMENEAQDPQSWSHRLQRPSSQSNLLDAASTATSSNSSSTTAPNTSRGGRLSRLTYKKTDTISFITEPRKTTGQASAASYSRERMSTDDRVDGPGLSNTNHMGVGLGIDASGNTLAAQQRDLILPSLAGQGRSLGENATEGAMYGHRAHADSEDSAIGQASSSHYDSSANSSAYGPSRAPSVAGTQGGYHNRFSKQFDSSQTPSSRHSIESSSQNPAMSVDPTSSSRPTTKPGKTSYEKTESESRGSLSDADIVAMGAVPGSEPNSLLNTNGTPLSSKNILTIALQKAQSAVQLDSANNVPEAISAYKQAVRLLQEVMDRIAPRSGKRSRPSREEERRRLRVIHDTYADRIRLLSMIYSPKDLYIEEDEIIADNMDYSYEGSQPLSQNDWLDRIRGGSSSTHSHDRQVESPRMNGSFLPDEERSPDPGAHNFLLITPVQPEFDHHSSHNVARVSTSSDAGTTPRPEAKNLQQTTLSPKLSSATASSPALDSIPRRPRRDSNRPGSRGSHGSRTSVSLSIAEEQEAKERIVAPPRIDEEMPQISVQAYPQQATNEVEEVLNDRNALRQRPEAEANSQHTRSDSDSSYQSTATAGRLKPVAKSSRSAFGLEDEVKTPVTPYFDAADVTSAEDFQSEGNGAMDSMRRRKVSLNERARADSSERPVRMGLAQRARALSFKGPLLRQKASMPVLSDRKSGSRVSNEPITPDSKRPSSADSPPEGTSSSERVLPGQGTEQNDPGSTMTIRPLASNRPRASTVTSSALVAPTTAAGTISQRRKLGGLFSLGNGGGAQDLESEVMQRSKSGSRSGNEMGDLTGDEIAFPSGGDPTGSTRSSSLVSSGRQRAVSQPSSRRPSIPASFISANAAASGGALPGSLALNQGEMPPPVPDLAKKLSAMELSNPAKLKNGGVNSNISLAESSGRIPQTNLSSLAIPLPEPPSGAVVGDSEEKPDLDLSWRKPTAPFLITDIFPSGLPSLAVGRPSYASVRHTHSASLQVLPIVPHALLRPFFVMKQLQGSIHRGAQVTDRLFVPKALWMQAGVKLVSVDTKVRALDLLIGGIETLEKGGEPLLLPLGSNAGLETSNASRFTKQLDDFEALLIEVQNNLAKKLPFLDTVTGNKGSKSFGTLSSRLTRGLDRMAGVGQAKSLDSNSLMIYVETLSRLFRKVEILSSHTVSLLVAQGVLSPATVEKTFSAVMTNKNADHLSSGQALQSPTGIGIAHAHLNAYSALPTQVRQNIQARLAKISDFFATVILAFALQDLGVLLEKFVKKGSAVFAD